MSTPPDDALDAHLARQLARLPDVVRDDPAALDRLRTEGRARRIVLVVESLYSVLGDEADLPALAALAAEHGNLRGTAIPADWPTPKDLGITLEEAGEGLA